MISQKLRYPTSIPLIGIDTSGAYAQSYTSAYKKRASLLSVTSELFFPPDEEQEQQIAKLAEALAAAWPTSGRGARPRDDANRYARPDFIKGLLGQRKSGSTYSYAGFQQLVHLSSGVVRFSLDPAAL